MRPRRLSRAASLPCETSFVRRAATVFDGETQGTKAQSFGLASAIPNTEHIVGHVFDDFHGTIDIAAKFLGAIACAVDQVVARRRGEPVRLTPVQRNRSVVR
jgi:hypothetical protein